MMNKLCHLGTATATGALMLAVFFANTKPTTFAMELKLRAPMNQEENIGVNLYNHHRRLEETNANFDNAVAQADKFGKSVRNAIKDLRGGTDEFYHDLIQAAKIYLCEQLIKTDGTLESSQLKPNIRFVSSNSDFALKDSDGNCIRYPITNKMDEKVVRAYKLEQCEVKPNCYWGPINITDPTESDRRPVYSMEESMPTMEGAMRLEDATNQITNWAQGLMIFVVPGIILGVLGLLTMIFFFICRCCCNRCGGRSPRDGGYSCVQKFLPVLFFFYLVQVL
jgi:hypothetical protein